MLATRLRNMAGYTQEHEKLIQLGSMAAGLAHELNNPATAAHKAARAGGPGMSSTLLRTQAQPVLNFVPNEQPTWRLTS
jgi:C4-dicarboxylate-specific signal transduction histidine kinase